MTQIQHLPADRPEPTASKRYLVVHIHVPDSDYDRPSVELYGTDDEGAADRLAERLHEAEIEKSGTGGSAYVLDTHDPGGWYDDADAKNTELDKLAEGDE